MWYSAGPLVNPAIDTILADAGAMGSKQAYNNVYIIVASSVAAVAVLEHRDNANGANLFSQYITVPAFGTMTIGIPFPVSIGINERWRLRLNAAITGSIQASIFAA